MIAVLLWGSVANNPCGFPADYPAEMMELPDGSKIDPPWVEMSKEEYESLSLKSREIARSLIEQKNSEMAIGDAQKLDGLSRLFDKCDATAAIWATATRAQKDDFLEDFYKIIRRQKRQILDQYRPE